MLDRSLLHYEYCRRKEMSEKEFDERFTIRESADPEKQWDIHERPDRASFKKGYIERSKITEEFFDKRLAVQLCDCGDKECEGWQVTNEFVSEYTPTHVAQFDIEATAIVEAMLYAISKREEEEKNAGFTGDSLMLHIWRKTLASLKARDWGFGVELPPPPPQQEG